MPDVAPTLRLLGATLLPLVGALHPLVLDTNAGLLECQLYPGAPDGVGLLWLGDADPGFPSPANGLFDRLAASYGAEGVWSLRVQYRNPGSLPDVGLDALVAARALLDAGPRAIIAIGHGAGALGAIHVALTFEEVTALALLAPTGAHAAPLAGLGPKPLFIGHGTADAVAPTADSRAMLAAAPGPSKRICYYRDAGHDLVSAAPAVESDLVGWLTGLLGS